MINLIVTLGRNLEIGKDRRLPWHLSSDISRFKELTKNKTVIMGRTTYESMLDIGIQDRTVYVVSRSPQKYRNALYADSVCSAIIKSRWNFTNKIANDIMIIGGVGVYREALPLADKAYVSLVEGDFQADRFFPVGLDYFASWGCDYAGTVLPDRSNSHQFSMYEFTRPNAKGLL